MSKEWFLVQFKANSHDKAIKNLTQQNFETFLPLYKSTSCAHSRFRSINRPLFPGYMFIAFNSTNTSWQKINSTYGVSRLVTFNSKLKPIPTNLINGLMNRCDLSGILLPIKKLREGDQVKVSNGPFANFVATVETFETDQRIWILLDLMGRKIKIQTKVDALQSSN